MKYTKEDKALIHSLLIIRNKGICEYTHWRAVQEFNRIKFKLAERIGSGPVVYLGHELLHVDPCYPDCNLSRDSKIGFSVVVNAIICRIAPPSEALKYMKEFDPLSNYWDNFAGWQWSNWTTVDRCYQYSPWDEVRHDDAKAAKWRKYNNY